MRTQKGGHKNYDICIIITALSYVLSDTEGNCVGLWMR